MSEPIKVGDLVVVCKPMPCCGDLSGLGFIFRTQVIELQCYGNCEVCGSEYVIDGAFPSDQDAGYPISVVKRIPPLSELESEERKQEIEA